MHLQLLIPVLIFGITATDTRKSFGLSDFVKTADDEELNSIRKHFKAKPADSSHKYRLLDDLNARPLDSIGGGILLPSPLSDGIQHDQNFDREDDLWKTTEDLKDPKSRKLADNRNARQASAEETLSILSESLEGFRSITDALNITHLLIKANAKALKALIKTYPYDLATAKPTDSHDWVHFNKDPLDTLGGSVVLGYKNTKPSNLESDPTYDDKVFDSYGIDNSQKISNNELLTSLWGDYTFKHKNLKRPNYEGNHGFLDGSNAGNLKDLEESTPWGDGDDRLTNLYSGNNVREGDDKKILNGIDERVLLMDAKAKPLDSLKRRYLFRVDVNRKR